MTLIVTFYSTDCVLVEGDNLNVVKKFCYRETVVALDKDISSQIRRWSVEVNRA